jgi:hypothetical protein
LSSKTTLTDLIIDKCRNDKTGTEVADASLSSLSGKLLMQPNILYILKSSVTYNFVGISNAVEVHAPKKNKIWSLRIAIR